MKREQQEMKRDNDAAKKSERKRLEAEEDEAIKYRPGQIYHISEPMVFLSIVCLCGIFFFFSCSRISKTKPPKRTVYDIQRARVRGQYTMLDFCCNCDASV